MKNGIGIIGYGHIGRALARGLLKGGVQSRDLLIAVRRSESEQAAASAGLAATQRFADIAACCKLIFLCTASTQALQTASELMQHLRDGRQVALVSMCAGVGLDQLRHCVDENVTLIKAIANINIATCNGFIVAFTEQVQGQELAGNALALLSRVGEVFKAGTEYECDCISAYSAAMPAYLATIISALIDAGIYSGASSEQSLSITLQVISATAHSLKELGLEPDSFKRQVTTPGGVVIRGTKTLEEYRVRAALLEAFDVVAQLVRKQSLQGEQR